MGDFKICYLGNDIVFSEAHCQVLKINCQYRQKATEIADKFEQKYDQYENYENFSKHGIRDGLDMLKPCLDDTVKTLKSNGVNDIDATAIISQYGEVIFSTWIDLAETVEKAQGIVGEATEDARLLRELRKASRGRVVGGGFGLAGAIKGIATAGAINTASGILHSGINAVGNSMTRVHFYRKLNAVYKSEEFREAVHSAIYMCVLQMGECLKVYLGISNIIPEQQYAAQARVILNNFSSIPLSEKRAQAAELLRLSADDIETYRFLLETYGDQDHVLKAVSQMVGIQDSVHRIGITLFQDECSKQLKRIQNELAKYKIEDVAKEKLSIYKDSEHKEIVSIAEHFGLGAQNITVKNSIRRADDAIDQCAKNILDADIANRTAFGKVYETVDLAEKAATIRGEGEELLKESEAESVDKVKECLEQMEKLNQTAPVGVVSDLVARLQARYDVREVEARTFHGTVLATQDEFNTVKRDYDSLVKESSLKAGAVTAQKLESARQLTKSPDYHQVATEAFLELVDAKSKELQKAQDNKKIDASNNKKIAIYTLIAIGMMAIVTIVPIYTMNEARVSFIKIVSCCITYFGQTENSVWLPCVILTLFWAPSALGCLAGLFEGPWASFMAIDILLLTYVIGAAVSDVFRCQPIIYILLVVQLVMAYIS